MGKLRITIAALGGLLLAAAAAALVADFALRGAEAPFRLRPLGEAWYRLDAPSLNLVQAVTERYIWPALWDPVALFALQQPAVLVFAVPGIVLLLLAFLARRREAG